MSMSKSLLKTHRTSVEGNVATKKKEEEFLKNVKWYEFEFEKNLHWDQIKLHEKKASTHIEDA